VLIQPLDHLNELNKWVKNIPPPLGFELDCLCRVEARQDNGVSEA